MNRKRINGCDLVKYHGILPSEIFRDISRGSLTPYCEDGRRVIDLCIPTTLKFTDQQIEDKYRLPQNCKPLKLCTQMVEGLFFDIDEVKNLQNGQNAPILIRREVALSVAKKFKQDYPNWTNKEAVQAINEYLKDNRCDPYSEKHLIMIIKRLGFKPGKPGRKSRN